MSDIAAFTSADFDAASAAWHANKIRRGQRLYYRCTAVLRTTGAPCPRIANTTTLDHDPTATHLCTQHARTQAAGSSNTQTADPSRSASS